MDSPRTGMLQQFSTLLSGILKVANSMTPLSGQINFQTSVEENANVIALQQELNTALANAIAGVTDSVQSLEQYNFLWNTDPNTFLHNFLHYTWYTPSVNLLIIRIINIFILKIVCWVKSCRIILLPILPLCSNLNSNLSSWQNGKLPSAIPSKILKKWGNIIN